MACVTSLVPENHHLSIFRHLVQSVNWSRCRREIDLSGVTPKKRGVENFWKLSYFRRKTPIFYDFGLFLAKSDQNWRDLAYRKVNKPLVTPFRSIPGAEDFDIFLYSMACVASMVLENHHISISWCLVQIYRKKNSGNCKKNQT